MWDSSPVSSRVRRLSPFWLLAIVYVALTTITLSVWEQRDAYGLTGDEPHYLVMADALVNDSTMDVQAAYEREFDEPRFYPPGLTAFAVDNQQPLQPPSAHVVFTDQGVFSWHGWGVPLLAAFILPWAGALGVSLLMAASGLVVLAAAWYASGLWRIRISRRLLIVGILALGYPVLIASNQIFPDLWAGAILLAIFAWLLRAPRAASWVPASVLGIGVGVLPWLGMKFTPAAIVVLIAVLAALGREGGTGRGRCNLFAFSVPVAVIGLALVGYHQWAFGNPLGPPTEGALAFGRDFWMLLPGLLLDQNQGLLMYNPTLWLALPGIALMWSQRRTLTIWWLGAFLAVWLPGASHPGLYGIGSFNGRYSWALACLALLPALYAGCTWASLSGWRVRALWAFLWAGLAFQIYLYILGTFVSAGSPGMATGLDFYTKPAGTWLETYSTWWFPLQGFLPAWYDPDWAFGFGVNYIWLFIAIGVLGGAFLFIKKAFTIGPRSFVVIALVASSGVAILGLVSSPGARSQASVIDRSLAPGDGEPRFFAQGPIRAMRLGPYTWSVSYAAGGTGVAGRWELVRAMDDTIFAAGELVGSNGQLTQTGTTISYRSFQPRDFYVRIAWYGTELLEIREIAVAHGSVLDTKSPG